MSIEKKIFLFITGFILAGLAITLIFPKERAKNEEAVIRIGAGDDLSGILMEEAAADLSGTYEIEESLESTSFQDC